jgi:hypothetical protein
VREGRRKRKNERESREEVMKGDYMDNEDVFYHTDRRNQH